MNKKMSPELLSKLEAIQNYIVDKYEDFNWNTFEELTGSHEIVSNHPRLFRSMHFGDDDYPDCVFDVIKNVYKIDSENLKILFEYYDIENWIKDKDPRLFNKIIANFKNYNAVFWKDKYLKVFISHLASEKKKVHALKISLEEWGISSFVAHDDIEPTKEWQSEIEIALETMELLIAFITPGFSNSNWTDQEIGYALGRNIDIIPLRVGADPYGFIGKIQGIQAKERYPKEVAEELVKILLRKLIYKDTIKEGLKNSLSKLEKSKKEYIIKKLFNEKLMVIDDIKEILENIYLSENEKKSLDFIIKSTKAFKVNAKESISDDIPF